MKKPRRRCKKCGRCCLVMAEVMSNTMLTREWVEARGYTVTGFSDTHVAVHVPSRCPQYDDERGCLIYDKRPFACRIFPTNITDHDLRGTGLTADMLIPRGCGYLDQDQD